MADKIPLSDLLVELRKELLDAQNKAEQAQLRFKVEDIDLELKVGATSSGTVGGGVKFWVYNAEAKGTISTEAVQTIRLKLSPVSADGGDTLVSGRDKK